MSEFVDRCKKLGLYECYTAGDFLDVVERLRTELAAEKEAHKWRTLAAEAEAREVDRLNKDVERLRKIEVAARSLIAMKGRHNTEIAYKRLEEACKEN